MNNLNKKNILISWPAHCFVENIIPIINNIYKEFNIIFITVDYDTPTYVKSTLNKLVNSSKILDFFFIPGNSNFYRKFKYLKKILPGLKNYNFDIWLTMSDINIYEKFIKEIVLNKNCKKIILWTQITYLFENEKKTLKLINNKISKFKNNHIKIIDYKKKNNLRDHKIIRTIKQKKFHLFFIFFYNYIYSYFRFFKKKIFSIYLNILVQLFYSYYFKSKYRIE